MEHPNILKVLGITEMVFGEVPCIVLPWMENGSIRRFISRYKNSPSFFIEELSIKVAKWVRVKLIVFIVAP